MEAEALKEATAAAEEATVAAEEAVKTLSLVEGNYLLANLLGT